MTPYVEFQQSVKVPDMLPLYCLEMTINFSWRMHEVWLTQTHSIKKSRLVNFYPYAFKLKGGFNNEQGYQIIFQINLPKGERPGHIVALHEIRSRHETNSNQRSEIIKLFSKILIVLFNFTALFRFGKQENELISDHFRSSRMVLSSL